MNNTPFENWLLRQRIYCEYGMCWAKATRVLKINKHDECRCDNHGYQPRTETKPKLERQPCQKSVN